MKDERTKAEPYIAPELARRLEQSQIGKYHTRGGTGFAAEDANVFADRIRRKHVKVTGTSNEANGADRVVDGVPIQTKYFPSASQTVENAFDRTSGQYRYGKQLLEVPKDQYDNSVRIMREKIAQGKVTGILDPQEAEHLVKKGAVTYKQARNIARAGNIDSIVFDVKTQSITTAYVFAVAFAVHFAQRKWTGDTTEDAINGAIESAIDAGATTLVAGVISAQVLRTRLAALGAVATRNGVRTVSNTTSGRRFIERLAEASLRKPVYGAAAVNHVAKLLRSNVITSTVVTVAVSTPDLYRAAIAKSISWSQLIKNLIVNGGTVAGGTGGWMGGAVAGAELGTVVAPGPGTVVGGGIGAIIGALGGGWLGTTFAKRAMDLLIEDDAKHMIELLQTALEELSMDFLFSEAEAEELTKAVKSTVDPKWLRSMYQAGGANASASDRQRFAYMAFEEICLIIARKRPTVVLPPREMVEVQTHIFAENMAMDENLDDLISALSPV